MLVVKSAGCQTMGKDLMEIVIAVKPTLIFVRYYFRSSLLIDIKCLLHS